MYKLFVIIVLGMPFVAFGRDVTGKVVDSDLRPVAFANVVLLCDTIFADGTASDTEGRFIIKNAPECANSLKVTIAGYDGHSMALPEDGNAGTVVINRASTQLGEVVVNAKIPATRLKGDALVTEVRNSVLSKLGTAYDVLAHVPMVTEAEGSLKVFGRGTPTVFINGREVRNSTELRQLKSEEIRHVELVTNPGASYSSETKAVIRIKTIPPKGDGFGLNVENTLNVWKHARNTTDLNLRYRHDRLEAFGNLYLYEGKRGEDDTSVMTTFGEKTFVQSIYNSGVSTTHYLSGKLGLSYLIADRHSIGAYYSLGHNKAHSNGSLDIENFPGGPEAGPASGQTHSDFLNRSKSFPSHEANLYYNGGAGRFSIDFNADYMSGRSRSDDFQRDNTRGEEGVTQNDVTADGLTKNRLIAEKTVVSHPLGNGKIEAGEEYTNSRLSYDYSYAGTPIDNSMTAIHENNIAAFVTLSQAFGKFDVTLGLRYEHAAYKYLRSGADSFSRVYDNLFPSASVGTKAGNVGLSLDFTSKMRRPSYRNLDGAISYINRYVYQSGNPLLKPTRSYNVQLTGMWKEFYSVLMYSHDRDAVFNTTHSHDDDPLVKVLTFMNVPRYQQLNFTLGARPTIGCWQPMPEAGVIKPFCSVTFRGEKTRFEKPTYYFSLNNVITLPGNWKLGGGVWIYSAGDAQNCHIKPTQQLNLSVMKSFLGDRLSVRLRAVNILDRGTTKVTICSSDIQTYMYNHHEPRYVSLTVKYSFNKARPKYKGTGAGNTEKGRM